MRLMKEQSAMTGANVSNRAVLYARVSSKDQEREGFSIPAQLKLLRQYALEHGLVIMQEFVDVETPKQAGRGRFGEMLAPPHADPPCRTVLVDKTDRLYRNIRDPLIASVFERYASGGYSLNALAAHAYAIGVTHPRSGRRMMKGEIHRILQNPIYCGEFVWLGTHYHGSHQALITRETFDQAQA